jgi:hypothetical protein
MARSKNILTKVCTKTGEKFTGTFEELTEFFYRDKSQKDGLSPWSKAAERAYNKAYTTGLKKAKVARKRDADEKGKKVFEAALKPERVKRGTFSNRKAKTAQTTPATTSRKRTQRNAKKA